MVDYQKLCENLKDLKLTQISLRLDEYITRVNEGNISIVNALYELTSKEIGVKNFNATNGMVKIVGFPHLQEMKDFDFDFQPKINKKQFLEFKIFRK
ncbi:ATP-binding protein [Clostridium caseinilyticum]|uniref:ATP-binding protein n=1 Tax=Clostridium caseinilyticum TaxID=3350403 RepID=UPI002433C5AD|nr:ATP-binding protein [Clostridium sporogenes]